MNRLTERTSDGIAYTKIPLNESHLNKRGVIEQCFTGFVADRLAAYEDIGLSPEEITDMIYRFEAFLCEMTGNRMSKSNYTLDAMISAANDYQQSLCDGCWDRSELAKYYELEHEKRLVVLPETGIGDLSDGYHTFNELYHHRAILFSVICNEHPDISWKSKLHHDGTMFDGMFIVGMNTPEGQATYHYDINPYWDMFRVRELEKAPEWDGHTSEQAIERIAGLTREESEKAIGGKEDAGRI
jgi:hypothetical protein